MKPETSNFHAQHSPMGAHSSFTIGMHNTNGGMAMEKGEPADGGVFLGYKSANKLIHFPFFVDNNSEKDRYVTENEAINGLNVEVLTDKDIERNFLWATDSFSARGITFDVYSPFGEIPDPKVAAKAALKRATAPVTPCKVTFRNDSDEDWDAFFALNVGNKWLGLETQDPMLKGMMSRESMGFATRCEDVKIFCDFTVEAALECAHKTADFLLGAVAGFSIKVPAGETKVVEFVLGYFKSGNVTYGKSTSSKYWYTRYFSNLASVLAYGLDNYDHYLTIAKERDQELKSIAHFNDEQRFLLAHATRSYYGSTQLLEEGGLPLWIVNEGEYLMMNTFDLTVDMMFFEMKYNPWTVANVIEQFVTDYRYYDNVFAPDAPEKIYPGGISFAHDMGVANHFSPRGRSSYEIAGLDRKCFSYMTAEQLTNWVLTAGTYIAQSQDRGFLIRHKGIFLDCLRSLQARDNPDPAKRNGLMGFDSDKTIDGGEITTYDSLDHSLGQARNNIYLAGKYWASYLTIFKFMEQLGETAIAAQAFEDAKLCAKTLTESFNEELGFLPAVLEEGNASAIIPAIEALVYPHEMGWPEFTSEDGEFGDYVKMLKRHFHNIYNKEMCLYEDGGWKLSSSADNSWQSKIFLCMYVAREVLGIDLAETGPKADLAHSRWQRYGSPYYACSDQFSSGKVIGSRYYPRMVTNILWLKEGSNKGANNE